MRSRITIWPWLLGAGALLMVLAILTFNPPLIIGALALGFCGAVFCRSETGRWPSAFLVRWWSAFRADALRFIAVVRARLLVAQDKAPGFWMGPARDETHAGYRADYEALVGKRHKTRADYFQIAELADGLRGYGDDPLAKPPKIQGFAALGGGGGLGLWPMALGGAVILALVASCAVLMARVSGLERARDAACTTWELDGRTSRQACRDLGRAALHIAGLEADLAALETERANAAARAVMEAEATRALNERNAARRRASAERLRRAHEDDLEAARAARAPDWDSRLRDLAEPALAEPGADEPAAGVDPASGMPAGRPR